MSKIVDELDKRIESLESGPEQDPQPNEEGNQGAAVAAASPSPSDPVSPPDPADPAQTVEPGELNAGEQNKPKRESWKKRFVGMKAYHDRTKSEDNRTIGNLLKEVNALTQELTTARKTISDLSNKQDPLSNVISPEDRKYLGDQGVESVEKLTIAAVDRATAPLVAEIERLRNTEMQKRDATATNLLNESYATFEESLLSLVPDYMQIDTNPEFTEYLRGIDELSGSIRFDLFAAAEANRDPLRVASFFKAFKKLKEPGVNPLLEDNLAPVGTTGSTVVEDPPPPEVLKMSDYRQFTTDLVKGLYRGREEEADLLEAKYDKALAEGRLV